MLFATRLEALEDKGLSRTLLFVTVCSHSHPVAGFVGIFVGIGRTNDHGVIPVSRDERVEADGMHTGWRARQPRPDQD
jgi:hypothetical protein